MPPRAQAKELLAWYEANRRALPWRETREPWAIWVSEIMLQQTRVEVVQNRWGPFLARYPDPASFAEISDDELLAAWKGLGYYRRARQLRTAAQTVVREHGGRVPQDPEALEKLAGIGPYTRGAIASIAFERAEAAIDGNVERVLARLLGIEQNPKRASARRAMNDAIADLHQQAAPGEVNQALMELGARVCSWSRPDCAACPWTLFCVARRTERTAELPQRSARTAATEVETEVLVAKHAGLLLVRRIEAGEINEGQLCLPGLGLPRPEGTELAAHLRARYGLDFVLSERLAMIKHSITRWRIKAHVRKGLRAPAPEQLVGQAQQLSYVDPADPRLPTTTVLRKALAALDEV